MLPHLQLRELIRELGLPVASPLSLHFKSLLLNCFYRWRRDIQRLDPEEFLFLEWEYTKICGRQQNSKLNALIASVGGRCRAKNSGVFGSRVS